MKKIIAAVALAISVAGATAQIASYSYTFNVNQPIPDADFNGFSDTHTVTGTGGSLASITNVTLTLDLSGGYNGDLYAYLVHGNGFVVLLNRVGRDGGNPFGYGGPGMNVTFSDAFANNIHAYQTFSPTFDLNGRLLGNWAPDGRNVSPLAVNGSETPNTSFQSFQGESADGQWTLYLADLSGGAVTTLNSWTLDIQTVPEPATASLVGLGVLGLIFYWRRK